MKKYLLLFTCALALLCASAFSVSAQTYDKVLVTYFGENGTLAGCRIVEQADDGSISLDYTGMEPGVFAKVYTMSLDPIDTVRDFSGAWQAASSPDVTPAPSPTQTPEQSPTPSPSPSATPAPTKEPTPPIYEKAADAITAFAVVDHAAVEATDNGETQYAVYVWYQGRERVLYLPDDMRLSNSSVACIFADNQKPTYLRCGDVVTFTTRLSGKINDISLVYRPQKDDIVTSDTDFGNSFEQLFSRAGAIGRQSAAVYKYGAKNTARVQYIFGVITDKNNRAFTLSNKGGKAADAADISFLNDTIIYTYDTSRDELSLGSSGDIFASEISDRDEEGNILSWSAEDLHHYALVRIIDGVATDVMLYQNYND